MGEVFWILLVAAAGPVIGSLAGVAFRPRPGAMGCMLAFAGGVMLAISFLELLPESTAKSGLPGAAAGLAVGFLVMAALECLLPRTRGAPASAPGRDLRRASVLMILALFLHNLPEGMAIAASTVIEDPKALVTVAFAIAIHNIPEGIAVSVPIYQATGSRRRAFVYSFLSGLAEPLGALLGWLVLRPIMSDTLFGLLFAGVAGIMVFISLDELLPAAREYGEHHLSIYGLIAGMAVMAVSLLLFL